jgi:predicted Co/Zn/Cd cation transporter (cation efflux family)
MILLILLTLYIPFRIAKVNLAELLLAAPEPETIRELEKRISPLLKNPSFEDHYARATKVGRTLYVHLYIVLTEGVSDWQTVSEQDRFRTHVFETLSKSIENVALDVIFTEDPCWAAGSVSKAPARS